MSVGGSIFIIAVGAIMRFAVTAHAKGFNINTAGTILMVLGIVGLVISLAVTSAWLGRDRRGYRYREPLP